MIALIERIAFCGHVGASSLPVVCAVEEGPPHNRLLMQRLRQQSTSSTSSWHVMRMFVQQTVAMVTRKIANTFLPDVFDAQLLSCCAVGSHGRMLAE